MEVVMRALADLEVVELEDLLRSSLGRLPSRALVVATFLAILELARIAALHVYQGVGERGVPEGPIRLRRADGPTAHGWRERAAEIE
jgi:chromatin segregation and condensation protein Rec8/ScpA/Scc1 (kleisin family)